MRRVIQMIKISDNNSIFLCNFNKETNELEFRSSYESKHLQKEIIFIKNKEVKTNLYHFPIGFLDKFLYENSKL